MVYQNYRRHHSSDRLPTLPQPIPAYFPTLKFQTFFPFSIVLFSKLNNAFVDSIHSLSLQRCFRGKFRAIADQISVVLRQGDRYSPMLHLCILSLSLWWFISFSGWSWVTTNSTLSTLCLVLLEGFFLLVGLGFLLQLSLYFNRQIQRQRSALNQAHTEIAELKQCLRTLCYRDELTDLANRRMFNQTIKQTWTKALQTDQSMAVVFIDVDHFKQYNDCYGHQQGDHCLQQVAQVIQRHAKRPRDLAARYGGEEFMLLLPNTTATEAQAIADQMLQDIQALQLHHCQSRTSKFVTASAGIYATTPNAHCTVHHFIEKADQALYQAKQQGRNQTQLFGIRQFKLSH